ncbi:PAS domain-containing protein [Thioalkalivibrio sp. ALE17]|uniref:PAS domain-containing protein n=1 Tax=Thioalkalivibrio sp. ALE17 TaxID=1158173 RepID=UPI0003F76D60|nr:PAS domain-containing protein [Thioalkalivibrio sp. ALE17]
MSVIDDSLRELQRQFVAGLPERLDVLHERYRGLCPGAWQVDAAAELHRHIHSLIGSAGTFGMQSVSAAARQLEIRLKAIVDSGAAPEEDAWAAIGAELERLQQLAHSPLHSEAPTLTSPQATPRLDRPPLIDIVEDDTEQAEHLARILRDAEYRVRIFSAPDEFRGADDAPDAVVLDMVFPEGDTAGAELLAELKAGSKGSPPVVVTSVRDDIEARLAALRGGARRYLLKPINPQALVELLDVLTGRMPSNPFRVLLVDDDPLLLEAQSVVLRGAGMAVQALSRPLEALEALDAFCPDVVVLDVHMSELRGPELAALVRERDEYLALPILFLSAETDKSLQLEALSQGGDDFLVKPVEADHLIAAVSARARRSRQHAAMQQRLQDTLYEREREHLALDQHAIVSMADVAGNIIYANDKFCEISGYQRAELIGQNHRMLKSQEHSRAFYEAMWETISSGQVWYGEICNRAKDGSLYWVQSTITPFLDEHGLPYQYVSIRTDITGIKAAEAAQRAQNAMRKVVGQAAADLLAAGADSLDAAIDRTLRRIGMHLGADCAYLFQFSEDGTRMGSSHEWCAPGVDRKQEDLQDIPLTAVPWWRAHLLGDQPVMVSDVAALPLEAAAEKALFESMGIRSFSDFPIRRGGKSLGAICFHHRVGTPLASTNLDLLGLLAGLVGSALLRAAVDREIREQQRFTQDVLDSVSAHIAVLDRDGVIVAVNEPWRRYGAENAPEPADADRGDDVGTNYLEICRHAEDTIEPTASDAARGIEAVIAGRSPRFRLEYPCHSPTRAQWYEMTVLPLTHEGRGVVVSHANITERKLAEQAAETAKERLRRGQMFANIGTWEWNIVTGELYWSERIPPLFGYLEGELETSYDNFLAAIHPEDRDAVIAAVNACVADDVPYDIEHRVVWPDGTVRWLMERGAAVRDADGRALRMIGVVQDIDDRKNAELALAERERQLVEAQALASLGNWRADLVSGELFWSDEIYRIFGHEPGSITPSVDVFYAAVHPDDLQRVRDDVLEAERTGRHDVVHRIVRPDGSIRHVNELAQAETDADGNLIRLTGTVQDVTEQVEAEQRIRESEERFVFAVEGAGDGVWDWDIKSGRMTFSGQYEPMLGYRPGELEPSVESWKGSVHPEDLGGVQQQLADYLAGDSDRYNVELRLRCKNGSYKWVLCRGTVVERDVRGDPVRMIGIHSDIDARKAAEETLQIFRHVVNSVLDGVLVIDAAGVIQLASPAVRAIFGYDQQDLVGNNVSMLMPDPVRSEHDGYLQRYRASGEARVINRLVEVTGQKADGAEFPLEVSVSEIAIAGQQYFVGLLRDISERKQAEEALVAAREEADRANQAKSEFLSSMSHELRTPMNAILGFGQLLEYDDSLGEEPQENVSEILRAGKHLLELINEILDLAKIESGRIDMSLEPVEVDPVVQECLSLVGTAADQRHIHLHHEGTEGVVVRADLTRLKQALLNLVSNAVKYNRDGGHVKVDTHREGSDRLRIRVADTGKGIPEDKLEDLFDPFNRLDAENSGIEGTGIGLTLTRRMVELMRGTVGVESEPEVGSTFWIELPLAGAGAEGSPLRGAEPALPRGASPEDCGLSDEQSRTVLYIEDNPANLRLVEQLVGQLPEVRLLTAHTPWLGMDLVREHRPDLILLDINLPGMDGYQVLEVLQAEAELERTPVVAVTANAMPRDIERGMAAGFADYLTKPLNVGQFLDTVQRHLAKRTT